jgi:hypothetical protein
MAATDCPILLALGDYDDGELWWNEDWQGKPKYSEKTRPSATLSTTNPTNIMEELVTSILGPRIEPRLPWWEASN